MIVASLLFARSDWLLPALAGAAAISLLMLWLYRRLWRDTPAFRVGAVAKLVALALLALCLAEPLWSSQRVRPGANLFLLVADNSRSLSLHDARQAKSRGERLRDGLTDTKAPWQVRLEQDFELRRYQFDALPRYVADFAGLSFTEDRTQLGETLRTLADRLKDRPVAGLLLFTDGNSTDDVSQVDWSTLPPVYPVPIGASDGHRDLSIASVATTTTAFEDAPVTLQVELAAVGLKNETVIVRVDDEQGQAVKHESQSLSQTGSPTVFRFQLRPIKTGVTFYRVRAAIGDDLSAFDAADRPREVTLDNNSRLVAVDRGTGPYRLLYVSGRPNWELKFLRRALADDDQLDLTALIRIAKKEAKFDFRGRDGESSNPLFRGFDKVDEETERYDQPVLVRLNTKSPEELRDGFPKTAEDLYQFHAVIIDDLEAAFFTAEQLSLLERFVSERGGGVLLLGGLESFRQGGYQKTAVGRMLPVYLDAQQSMPPATGYRLALTREGWLEPWARLRSTELEETRRLREMPGFLTMNTVSGLKPGASVIGEAVDPQGRKAPALVAQRYGKGRSAALMIGDLWRWQLERTDDQRANDDLGKAWRQMLRWLIVDVPDPVELKAVRESGGATGLMSIEARIRDKEYRPQDNAVVTVDVTTPDGSPLSLTTEPSLKEPGLYETTVASRPAGAWRAKVTVSDPDGKPLGASATGWAADFAAEELARVSPNRPLLERIAQETGGQVVEWDDLSRFVETLPNREAPLTETTTTPLWHNPLVWLLIVAGLCTEWGLRRRRGLP
jgi:uncharacterized membrane protein